MKLIPTLFSLILTCNLQAETEEPKLSYELLIGEKRVDITADNETVVEGDFSNPKIRLIPSKVRLFNYAGISFEYPSNFAFEADLTTPGIKIWTLDGNDNVIMIQKHAGKIELSELMMELKTLYGEGVEPAKVKHMLGGKEYSGLRVKLELATIKIIQDYIQLPCKDGSLVMMVQDFPIEEKISDAEIKNVLKLLNTSFKQAQP